MDYEKQRNAELVRDGNSVVDLGELDNGVGNAHDQNIMYAYIKFSKSKSKTFNHNSDIQSSEKRSLQE